MNRHFYEFWGNYFNNVARGQKQLEDVSTWMKKGFDGTDELSALFKRCYGLDASAKDNEVAGAQSWQQAMADFQQTFAQFAKQWGWVTETEHQQLQEKCAALEKEVEQQKETISRLRDLLYQEGRGHAELFDIFKGTFEEQSKQFYALMDSIGKAGKDKT